ncbi:hypothetical protein ACRAWF_25705 [Streptomyces sp. L7]
MATADDIAVVQEFFADRLPTSWTSWVTECGAPSGYGRALLGLGPRTTNVPADAPEDVLDVLMLLRLTEPGFGIDLLPLEVLPDRQLHCLSVGPAGPGTVVLVDLDRPGTTGPGRVEPAQLPVTVAAGPACHRDDRHRVPRPSGQRGGRYSAAARRVVDTSSVLPRRGGRATADPAQPGHQRARCCGVCHRHPVVLRRGRPGTLGDDHHPG